MAGTVIEALRRFLPRFQQTSPILTLEQHRAIRAMEECRTAALGGELYTCRQCSHRHFAYHSCNHKACPQCGRQFTQQWVQRELAKRVVAPYFMVNFTLPAGLRSAFFGPHARQAFDYFFKVSSRALAQVLAAPKWLGATVSGFTGLLHTWNQQLLFHPHIHYLVPGAGLDARGRRVQCASANYLVNVAALRRAFVTQWRQHLHEWPEAVDPKVWQQTWGVYIKTFGSGTQAVKYLGAYVARTAIGDRRIREITQDTVTFSWKDRRQGNRIRTSTVEGTQFVERYLRHVLPKGLRSIRYYGFFHPTAHKKRRLIQSAQDTVDSQSTEDLPPQRPPSPAYVCPRCRIPLQRTHRFNRHGQLQAYHLRGPPPSTGPLEQAAA